MNKKFEEELLDVFKKASAKPELLREFLLDILTPVEYKEIVTRWQIVKRLDKGEAQRAIAKDLKIGIATVTRGSRELSNPNGGFARLVKKSK
ncbi:MAG: transcriptional regulator [Candidatus Pacebacteria bacterium]|nr:transcriptional regulator [Candidatus Paceibacterota bacterium]